MAQPDWERGDLDHRLMVQLVDPLNLTTVKGELNGVERGGKMSYGYYVDDRYRASISTAVPKSDTDGWDGLAAMRLVHVVSDYTGDLWDETLGTFYVVKADEDVKGGKLARSYELKGTLYGLSTNVTPRPFTIAKGSTSTDVIKRIMKTTSRPYRMKAGVRNYKYSGPVVYDAGKSYLSILFDVCNRAQNRVSVDPDGFVSIRPYTAPSSTSPSFSVDFDSRMFVGPWTTSDTRLELPERVIVVSTKDKQTITGTAVAAAGTRMRHSRRGYGIDDFRSVNNMNPFTQKQADSLAKSYLATADTEAREAGHGMRYRPLADT